MIVGVCRVHLFLPENHSLKGKRSVVRRLVERAKGKFNVAAAEVGNLDDHQRAEIGFAVVSTEGRHANAMLDKIATYCEETALAEIAGITTELIPLKGPLGEPMVKDDDVSFPDSWQR